jgi:NDP-sugar pyrophosphorylase family protein
LSAIGIVEVVINISHLASRFPQTLGDGSRWNLKIHYLDEGPMALETGGRHAQRIALAWQRSLRPGEWRCLERLQAERIAG